MINVIPYSFSEDPQAYLIGSLPYNFNANLIQLTPGASPLNFIYSSIESGTTSLPSDWINMTGSLDFSVQTDDLSLQSTKIIEKIATCTETSQ